MYFLKIRQESVKYVRSEYIYRDSAERGRDYQDISGADRQR